MKIETEIHAVGRSAAAKLPATENEATNRSGPTPLMTTMIEMF